MRELTREIQVEHEAGRESPPAQEDPVEPKKGSITQSLAFAVVAAVSAVVGGAFLLEVAMNGAPALAVAGAVVGGVFEGLALLAAVLAVKEFRRAPAR